MKNTKMQMINKQLLIVVAIILFSGVSFGGNIVFPWRAMKAIVKSGESFAILYDNLKASGIDGVTLQGPFNQVKLSIDSVNIGLFEYDSFTHSAANNKIWVTIPSDAPEELYDLVIKCGGETFVSNKSVKVVREFSKTHFFIHISDTHISREWVGKAEDGYAKELELFDRFVDVANIIAPDFVIVTGDIIHHYTRFNADPSGWGGEKLYDADLRPLVEEKFRNYYEGAKGFKGVHGLNSPVFSLPGNHDSYGVPRDNHFAMASQWNQMCGERVYGFSYAGTRVLAADDYLGDPITDIPDSLPMSGLQGKVFEEFFEETGAGDFRILAQHRYDRVDTSFILRHNINLLLNGHSHYPLNEYVGTTKTLSSRPGVVCRSGEIARWEETLGFFRIFYVNKDSFSYTPALRFCKNPTVPYNDLELNLTLLFKFPNDGSYKQNEATIQNSFDVDLPNCKIRFVMKKGNYKVTGGEIRQVIESGNTAVVDVTADVLKKNNKIVKILLAD